MKSLKELILDVINGDPIACLATVTETGKPWVRYVSIRAGEDLLIKFATFVNSRKVAQIKANPEVHITCGVTQGNQTNEYIQVEGRAEITRDPDERHSFWTDGYKAYFTGPDDPNYTIVIVRPYRIELNTGDSPKPEILELFD